MSQTAGIVAFIVGIVVSIMIHEWGHFWTARRFGMRADRYFLGFGPTLWSTHRGETEYGVKALPLGGFVRILGMSPDDTRLPGVADQWLDPARRDPDAADQRSADDPMPGTLEDLTALLVARGTSAVTAEAITEDVKGASLATPDAARAAVTEAIGRHVADDEDKGTRGMRHRLFRGDEGRFFGDKRPWQRAIVLAAGSGLHMAIAVVLLLGGLLLLPQPVGVSATIDAVQPDTPAAAAGLQPGDVVLGVNEVTSDDFLVLRDELRAHPDEPVTMLIERDGEQLSVDVTPMATEDPDTGQQVGVVGFAPGTATARMSPPDALWETFVGPSSIPKMTWASIAAIGDVFGPEGIGNLFNQLTGQEERTLEGGISMVGGATVTGQGVQTYGIMFLISMLVSINVFIGVFNILPLPPLDGGHLAVLAVEKGVNLVRGMRGRAQTFKVRHETVASIAIPVLIVIATVGLGLVWLDIASPVQLP